ncbi:Spy/CpxP family protein refolding chaperone [Eikenella sp. Marseille-P7795]|uniref:Spy/CpxP family protein refolding chaperone n=1 Tax=Eikenella sp. Marseille-P7795 TaxID=2866577 RepID=UPI001CE46454|nr:Spy/CpxP family protein refolding chaperone [Eikenella sp. Marseille-P7795]
MTQRLFPRRQALCRCFFASVMLAAGSAAWADGPCDMRQLSLSSSQQEQMRQVRAEYRQRLDNLVAQSRNLRQYTTQASNLVLAGPVFDDNMARHYVNEKYAPQMQREVENLRAQHALLQILTPQQRQEWMRHCMHHQ